MRIGILAFLSCTLVAGPSPVDVPASRVENRAGQTYLVIMGSYVAGRVHIREAGGRTELARLNAEGDSFRLEPGKAVDITFLPTKNGLALQVRFSTLNGSGVSSSVFVSQGLPRDKPTLNINEGPSVHLEKAFFGQSRNGAFVVIKE
jgi:hypothetical protein